MSAWRREALIAVPELRSVIDQARNPMALWIELTLSFDDAVASCNKSLFTRIFRFAAWCGSDRSGLLPSEASTAVHCAFYEHLPVRKAHWPLMSKWFSSAEFKDLLPTFAYHLSAEELKDLQRAFQVSSI